MTSTVQQLMEKKIITPPKWMGSAIHYEVQMGSVAYGVSNDNSDIDIYGFAVPPRSMIFPHEAGYIHGFDKNISNFEQYSQHHIKYNAKEYDISIYGILKYFKLCMECNPNMIDSLFVPDRCVLHSTQLGQHVRENRKEFLHKGAWHRYKGYSYSQIHKMKSKTSSGKRKETIDEFGYDCKFGYHVVRLLDEVEQIMVEGDIDLERNREQLKAIRRGEWTLADIEAYFSKKEQQLESVYADSHLRNKPNVAKVKQILIDCLEMHYGSLDKVLNIPGKSDMILQEIRSILDRE